MNKHLSENEKAVLNYFKEEYEKKRVNPLPTVQPKIDVKITENIPKILQEKGYIEIVKTDLGSDHELISVNLKDKFFEYFSL